MNIRLISLVCSSLLAACAFEAPAGEELETDQPIVRGKAETAFPQVVMLHAERASGLTRCSGTYVAPRVVLTAAHCIRNDVLPGRFFVYHGNNYAADVAALPQIPAPGRASSWARAETWTLHPSYDAALNYPDLAIVYLDRALPFAPLPLRRARVDASFVGKRATVVGWGANAALAPDLSQVSGVGVKRSGKQTILGSPTERDYIAEDPNAGLLVPAIRSSLLKLDGAAPLANTCAGDSGGPMILEQNDGKFLAGVAFWTGLSCETYSMFTRIDPFVGFIDGAFRAAGQLPIVPRLECVHASTSGTLTAYFGYDNRNGVTVDVPYDTNRNALALDVHAERPTAFAPGNHPWVFGVDFSATQSLTYRLAPTGLPTTVLTASAASPRCASGSQQLVCARRCEASLAAQCFDGSLRFEQCQSECMLVASQFAGCERDWNNYLGCVAKLSPASHQWQCSSGFVPEPVSPFCDGEFAAALSCAGF